MIRVPKELHTRLADMGLRWESLGLKEQGNHEDNQASGTPLWRVIEELLRRDDEHRIRARSNSAAGRWKKAKEPQAGGESASGKQEVL